MTRRGLRRSVCGREGLAFVPSLPVLCYSCNMTMMACIKATVQIIPFSMPS